MEPARYRIIEQKSSCNYSMKSTMTRHQDDKDEAQTVDYLTSIHKCYESVLSDEKDAYELTITPDMDPDDVVQKVLDLIKNTKPSQHKKSKVCILI